VSAGRGIDNNTSDVNPEFKLLETVAALTSEIYVDHNLLYRFDQRVGEEPFVTKLADIIDISRKFEAEAKRRKVIWDESHDWILCIEKLADQFAYDPAVDWDRVFTKGVR
jgi:hypothetical protein